MGRTGGPADRCPTHRRTDKSAAAPRRYDNAGNLTSETNRESSYGYTYDKDGRLTSQTGPDFTTSYKYDVFGRRIEQNHNGTVTKFVYDGQQVLVDLNASNTTIARYTIGPIIDEVLSVRRGGSTYHYVQDV